MAWNSLWGRYREMARERSRRKRRCQQQVVRLMGCERLEERRMLSNVSWTGGRKLRLEQLVELGRYDGTRPLRRRLHRRQLTRWRGGHHLLGHGLDQQLARRQVAEAFRRHALHRDD